MTYHCPGWAEHVSFDISEGGETLADLYEQYRCTRFEQSVMSYIDMDGDLIDSDSYGEVDCSDHSVSAAWNGSPELDDLTGANIEYEECGDCEAIFPNFTSAQEHGHIEHGHPLEGEEDEDAAPHVGYGSLRYIWIRLRAAA